MAPLYRTISALVLMLSYLSVPAIAVADDEADHCWSLMKTKAWPGILQSARNTKLCEALPGGPDRTQKFEPTQFDICSSSSAGLKIAAVAEIECKSSSGAIFESFISTRVTAEVSLNVGDCKIAYSEIGFSGDGGSVLSGISNIQEFARSLAQAELTKFCQGK